MVRFDRVWTPFWRHFCCVIINKEKSWYNLANTGVSNAAEEVFTWGEPGRLLCNAARAEIQVFGVASCDVPALSARSQLSFHRQSAPFSLISHYQYRTFICTILPASSSDLQESFLLLQFFPLTLWVINPGVDFLSSYLCVLLHFSLSIPLKTL